MVAADPQKMLVVSLRRCLIAFVSVGGHRFSPAQKERTAMSHQEQARPHDSWAHLRFSIVGPLLAAPPEPGELKAELERLASKEWLHAISEQPVRFALSTIERWYYAARAARTDPVGVLRRALRKDSGQQRVLDENLCRMIEAQYRAHKRWSYQLHFDNLQVLVHADPKRPPMPSYSTIRRYMKNHDFVRQSLPRGKDTPGLRRAEQRRETREVRSYESGYVSALWHLDFHHGSRKVMTPEGSWATPLLLGILDDRSRLVCHLLPLELVAAEQQDRAPSLRIATNQNDDPAERVNLEDRVIGFLSESQSACTADSIRAALQVRKQRVLEALRALLAKGEIRREGKNYILAKNRASD